ncbi:hypothetical protein GH714_013817 [Hevea brasiliensis]|uniref:CCHC-type domain-containing protein n=1 Tax=Hevea brasiliensis TaxID=3981 RepID=A0A6A6K4H7_HEVBR|nr:hypothetical protein GH714_013817 [Hevea brasiliensis]
MMLREKTRQIYYPTYDKNDHQAKIEKEETSQDVSLGGNVEISKNPASVNNKASGFNPPKTNNPYAKPIPINCYRCNEMEHRSNECPKRKFVNIIEKHDDGAIYCGLDGEDEEEDCEQDESACLMRRPMHKTGNIYPYASAPHKKNLFLQSLYEEGLEDLKLTGINKRDTQGNIGSGHS